MATPNSEYWKQRFAQLEAAQNRRAQETFIDVGLAYRQAEKQLEADVDRWYRRFADNNGVTLPEARKLLTKGELREFKWDVREYMKYAEENMITGQWEKELENASARYHISRLEALKINTAAAIEELYNKEEQKLNFHLSEEYQTDYYRTIYEIQNGYNSYFEVAKLDLNRIDKLLKKPWAPDGYNFSERIWNDKNKLINNVHRDLMQCIMTGEPLNKAIDRLTKRMNTARYNAERLIRTESAWSASLATEDGFKELDVEKYEIIAALDDRTCAGECQGLDGQVYEMKDYQAGLTAPPFHPNCRCTTAPHFDKWYGLKRQRAARDEEGKTYQVDKDLTYPQWKAKYVDKVNKNTPKPIDKNGESGIIKTGSEKYNNLKQLFADYWGVESRPVGKLDKPLTSEEIIKKIGGGDLTEGSCSSLAFAYVGNKNGLDVTDYRGGDSQRLFAKDGNIKAIMQLSGVNGQIITVRKEAPEAAMILQKLEKGKEYYFAAGRHAAIVRNAESGLEYLELQTQAENGWKSFNKYGSVKKTLNKRFGCRLGVQKHYGLELTNEICLADTDNFKDSEEFRSILSFLNTAADKQQKGAKGFAR